MEWVESTASTIDEAKERALDRLGVHEDDAEFDVVSDVTTGLFGRVKEEARVRARVRPATPRAKDDRRRPRGRSRGGRDGGRDGGRSGGNRGGKRQDSQKGSGGKGGNQGRSQGGGRGGSSGGGSGRSNDDGDKSRANEGKERKNRSNSGSKGRSRDESRGSAVNEDTPTMTLPEQADIAEAFVQGLAERFGNAVEFAREDIDDEEIRITVSGDDLGLMIGHRGNTAGSIDELVRTVLQRQAGSGRNGRVRVDIGGVRARRAAALSAFARTQADEVVSSGSARSLEAMASADRKIVHDALSEVDGVRTISEGEDPRRRVVIVPEGDGD